MQTWRACSAAGFENLKVLLSKAVNPLQPNHCRYVTDTWSWPLNCTSEHRQRTEWWQEGFRKRLKRHAPFRCIYIHMYTHTLLLLLLLLLLLFIYLFIHLFIYLSPVSSVFIFVLLLASDRISRCLLRSVEVVKRAAEGQVLWLKATKQLLNEQRRGGFISVLHLFFVFTVVFILFRIWYYGEPGVPR